MSPFRIFGNLRSPGAGQGPPQRITNITVNGVANFIVGARDVFVSNIRNGFQSGGGPFGFLRPMAPFLPPFMQNMFGGGNSGTIPPEALVAAAMGRVAGQLGGGMQMGGMPMGGMPMGAGPMGAINPMAPPAAAPARIAIEQMTIAGLIPRAQAGNLLLAGGGVNEGLLPGINAGNAAAARDNINNHLQLGGVLDPAITARPPAEQRQICLFIAAYIDRVANFSPAQRADLNALAGRWRGFAPAAG